MGRKTVGSERANIGKWHGTEGDANIYHLLSKKLCQLIFCSLSVKYERISIKIGIIVPEESLNKTVLKIFTSVKLQLKIV